MQPPAAAVHPALVGDPPLLARARFTSRAKALRLDITRGRRVLALALRRRVLAADVSRGTLTARLGLAAGPRPIGVTVVLTDAAGKLAGRRAGAIAKSADGAVLTCVLTGSPRLPAGPLRFAVGRGRRGRPVRLGRLDVSRLGRVRSVTVARRAAPSRDA
jgi:hypothetical protein